MKNMGIEIDKRSANCAKQEKGWHLAVVVVIMEAMKWKLYLKWSIMHQSRHVEDCWPFQFITVSLLWYSRNTYLIKTNKIYFNLISSAALSLTLWYGRVGLTTVQLFGLSRNHLISVLKINWWFKIKIYSPSDFNFNFNNDN